MASLRMAGQARGLCHSASASSSAAPKAAAEASSNTKPVAVLALRLSASQPTTVSANPPVWRTSGNVPYFKP